MTTKTPECVWCGYPSLTPGGHAPFCPATNPSYDFLIECDCGRAAGHTGPHRANQGPT
jgi:hypothetical protein